jgi:hypothetical protein
MTRAPLLSLLASLLAQIAAPAWAADSPGNSQANESPESTEAGTGWDAVWGAFWYLRSLAEYDDLTFIYGGVEGSSALVLRDNTVNPATSTWIFLEGKKLFVSPGYGSPTSAETITPGKYAMSFFPGGPSSQTAEYDRRELSYLLIDLRINSIVFGMPPGTGSEVIHAPFLTGPGWGAQGGAHHSEAANIASQLGLTFQIVGSPQQGFVTTQNPPGGALMGAGAVLSVELEAGQPLEIASVDTMETAHECEGEGPYECSVTITPKDDDDLMCPLAPQIDRMLRHRGAGEATKRRDVFIRLPPETRGKDILVRQAPGRFDALMLTAFHKTANAPPTVIQCHDGSEAASAGRTADLYFRNPDTGASFIMVEFCFRDTGIAKLNISAHDPEEEDKPEQSRKQVKRD